MLGYHETRLLFHQLKAAITPGSLTASLDSPPEGCLRQTDSSQSFLIAPKNETSVDFWMLARVLLGNNGIVIGIRIIDRLNRDIEREHTFQRSRGGTIRQQLVKTYEWRPARRILLTELHASYEYPRELAVTTEHITRITRIDRHGTPLKSEIVVGSEDAESFYPAILQPLAHLHADRHMVPMGGTWHDDRFPNTQLM